MIVHEVPVTYPGTWGTCISSLSFETLHKGMKSIIIHHPDVWNTKKTLAWMFINNIFIFVKVTGDWSAWSSHAPGSN